MLTSRRPPQMRSPLVRAVLAYVRARGGDPDRLIREHGLPATAEEDLEVALPLPTLHAFLDSAQKAIDDPCLGIHVAGQFARGTYGLLEYSWRSAPTIVAGIERLVHYAAFFNDFVLLSFQRRCGAGVLTQTIPGYPLCVGRQGNEFFVAAVLLQARHLVQAPVVPERVWFGHPAPKDCSELFELLGTDRVEFEANGNGLELSQAVLALPIVSSDPPLFSLLGRYAERELAARVAPSRFLGQIRQSIHDRLSDGSLTLVSVALGLRLSPRSLQRRISEEGTSFHALVESVREEVARAHVADASRPFTEIAFILGYAEQRPFHRAFRRWTGMTPGQYRARGPGGTP